MTDTQNRKLHPLLAAAAVAVILLSGVGIAKMLNWLPGSDPAAVAAEHQAEADRLATEARAAEEAAKAEAEASAKAEAERVAEAKAAEARVAAEKAEATRIAARKAAAAERAAAERAAAERQARANQGGSVQQVSTSAAQYASTCATCGVVTNVSVIRAGGDSSGVGAVAGAILGGVLGHQVGGGSGKKVATAAGAIGGAYAGNAIEGRTRGSTTWNVSVQFEDGRSDVFSYPVDPQVSAGERVRLEGGQLVRR